MSAQTNVEQVQQLRAEVPVEASNDLIYIQAKLNAPKTRENKFGGFSYRSAEDILEALKPLLDEVGCRLIVSDEIVVIGEGELARFYVKATATLTDEFGDTYSAVGFAREPQDKKGMDDSQITGTASSYARKYALNGLFLIDDSRDPDELTIVAESEVDAFTDLVENEEGAKLFLMQLNEREKYMALSKSAAPKGGKVAFKKTLTDLVMGAVKTAQETAERILELVEKDDTMGIREITDELDREEKTMVWRQFDDAQQAEVQRALS